jgi:hypothetical protein
MTFGVDLSLISKDTLSLQAGIACSECQRHEKWPHLCIEPQHREMGRSGSIKNVSS